jgi:DNA polymerase-3 subunit delta
VLAGKDCDLATVTDTLRTVSMWNPRQLVYVEDADEFVTKYRAGLEKYLEKPAKKSVLVLDVKSWPSNTRLAKKTVEIGLPLDCGALKLPDLIKWLMENSQSRHGRKLDRVAAETLVELAGPELGLLDQELEKLAAFVGEKGTIDSKAVETLVGGWRMETTWKMLDAVRDGQLAVALELLDKLLVSGEHPLKLLGGINYVYRQLAQATELSRQGIPLPAAVAQAGVKPFQAQAAANYLKRLGRPRAEKIYRQLLQADLDLKGASQLPERVLMERLLMQLGGKAG